MASRKLFPWDNPEIVEALDRYPNEILTHRKLAEVLSELANMPITHQAISKRLNKMGRSAAPRNIKKRDEGEKRKSPKKNENHVSGQHVYTEPVNVAKAKSEGVVERGFARRLSQHLNRTLIDVTGDDGTKRKFVFKRRNIDGSSRFACHGCRKAKYGERKAAQEANRPPVPIADGRVKYITLTCEGVIVDDGTPHMEHCKPIDDVAIAVEETTRREVEITFMHMAQVEAGLVNAVQYERVSAKKIPQQKDGVHCGVFSLAYASYITSGKAIVASPNQEEIKHWRQLTGYIAYCGGQQKLDRLDFLLRPEETNA